MKKTYWLQILCFAVVISAFVACQKDADDPTTPNALTPNLPDQYFTYADDPWPDHFQSVSGFDNTPDYNPITDAGATLGRVLFYDKKLSLNNTISCGSCHLQQNAFADPDRFSVGFEGQKTHRNSLSLVNPRFSTSFFWDSRTFNLEEQVLQPVQNHIEMGLEDMDNLAEKLSAVDYYPELFDDAFGSTEVTAERISYALAQFLRSMSCKDSKFDKGMEIGDFSNYTPQEKLGFDLFNSEELQCANCHRSVNFYYGSAVNIGLDTDYADEGVGDGRFRIPSLRNVALTAPFMHDGRFETLEEVIEHYNSGVKSHPALDWRLQDQLGNPVKLNLTNTEKEALVAFLRTLTDYDFIQDPKYSDPF